MGDFIPLQRGFFGWLFDSPIKMVKPGTMKYNSPHTSCSTTCISVMGEGPDGEPVYGTTDLETFQMNEKWGWE